MAGLVAISSVCSVNPAHVVSLEIVKPGYVEVLVTLINGDKHLVDTKSTGAVEGLRILTEKMGKGA